MISSEKLSVAQERWCALVKHYFEEVYSSGKITHKQLGAAHEKFKALRKEGKKFKVGWPIWLISNNAESRGVYTLPHAADEDVEVTTFPKDDEFDRDMERFGVILTGQRE